MKIIALLLFLSTARTAAQGCWDDSDCDTASFCGIDKTCHMSNCQDWYMFGDPKATGRYQTDKDSPVIPSSTTSKAAAVPPIRPEHELSCGLIEPDWSVGPWAAYYSCDDDYFTQGHLFEDTAIGLPFNVKCKAQTESGAEFQCFSLFSEEDDDKHFDKFLSLVDDLPPLDCTIRFQPLQIRHAKPVFSIFIAWESRMNIAGSYVGTGDVKVIHNATFDSKLARIASMRSILFVDEPPESVDFPNHIEDEQGQTAHSQHEDDLHSSGVSDRVQEAVSAIGFLLAFSVLLL